MADNGIDPKVANSWAQNSHWAGGLAWVFGSIVLFGPQFMWYFIGAGVLISGVKEFWYDYHYETTAERGSSLEDFTMYCVGFFGAAALYLIRWKVIR